ncbi:MAG: hypothetical protein H8D78_06685 [Chloroflexi bacterium]|nr:hypothetical protein [Chloroflexota bacterium]
MSTQEYIFDAGPLITGCKFAVREQLVIDHLLKHCRIVVPRAAQQEVVIAGRRHADALQAEQRIAAGAITVTAPTTAPESLKRILRLYELGGGEYQSILLAHQTGICLAIDDYLGYLVCDRLGVQKRFLLDVLVRLAREAELDRELAREIADSVRPRYTTAMVEHTLLMLEEESYEDSSD